MASKDTWSEISSKNFLRVSILIILLSTIAAEVPSLANQS